MEIDFVVRTVKLHLKDRIDRLRKMAILCKELLDALPEHAQGQSIDIESVMEHLPQYQWKEVVSGQIVSASMPRANEDIFDVMKVDVRIDGCFDPGPHIKAKEEAYGRTANELQAKLDSKVFCLQLAQLMIDSAMLEERISAMQQSATDMDCVMMSLGIK